MEPIAVVCKTKKSKSCNKIMPIVLLQSLWRSRIGAEANPNTSVKISSGCKRPFKVLLLQGPVGPFFAELHGSLIGSGFSVNHVIFNAGDQIFSTRRSCVRFSGTLAEWETWLRFEFAQNKPDVIILFGSNRPAHKIARQLAEYFSVDVLSLEEGYLRSGYVSCERGGNNEHSPLAKSKVKSTVVANKDAASTSTAQSSSFAAMSLWGAAYYVVRDFGSKSSDVYLFHRRRERILPLAWSWGVHLLRRLIARATELVTKRSLHGVPSYILIPLQVSSDSQLQEAARGWSTPRLIEAALRALAASSNNQRVVFKLHPMERGSADIKRLIYQKAKCFGVGLQHICVLHTGRMGDLAKQASGMIVINSTSAFSALHHNIPLLVLGEGVFRHDEIVTIGETEADIAAFFKLRHVKSREMIDAFFAELKTNSLIPGDFYISQGRKVAIEGIIGRLHQIQPRPSCRMAGCE